MITGTEVGQIHSRLAELYSPALVLLGGSYLYGGATDESDLDFYAICSLSRFLYFWRHKQISREIKEQYPAIKVMIIPAYLYEKAWYYVYGRDIRGAMHCAYSEKYYFRHTVKLAHYSFLKYLVAREEIEKSKLLAKCAQSIVGILPLIAGREIDQPAMSRQTMEKSMTECALTGKNVLAVILDAKFGQHNIPSQTMSASEAVIEKMLESIRAADRRPREFSLLSYLVYNIKYLKDGYWRFLLVDPDKYIVDKMSRAIGSKTEPGPLLREMEHVVFPVLVH